MTWTCTRLTPAAAFRPSPSRAPIRSVLAAGLGFAIALGFGFDAAAARGAGAGPDDPPSASEAAPAPASISFHERVRPILQANCQGCHQPAKANGAYVMTDFARLLAGGESGEPAIVPGKPDESPLIERITPVDGRAEMPPKGPPLSAADIETIARWIKAGAIDDTPSNAVARYDADHPPVYSRAPVITALAYSPDGSTLAVAGFHEVLLMSADGSERLARLIGLSERIESLAFSPDGRFLAVTGGLPARMGEVQIWDVAARKLKLSVPVTYDTVYGASWSPDGKLVAFGCADNSVRAIDAETGEQVLFMGGHNDWALGTVFSTDGSHVVSVSRDMTTKLTEVATQRFVDNITSITPGALKGGVSAVARHPARDEIVVGGSDGVPRVYRMHRLVTRVIGDDSNLIRQFPPMRGRIAAVDVSRDGTRFAAVSRLDGRGEIAVFGYEFDTGLPDDVKAIMAKVASSRSADENAKIEAYINKDVVTVFKVEVPDAAIYTVAFRPDGGAIAVGGADGAVRLLDAKTGAEIGRFSPAPVAETGVAAAPRDAEVALASATADADAPPAGDAPAPRPFSPNAVPPAIPAVGLSPDSEPERLPAGRTVESILLRPDAIRLRGVFDSVQIVAMARLDNGDLVDATRLARISASLPIVEIGPTGHVTPFADGEASLTVELAGRIASAPVSVAGVTGADPGSASSRVDYVRDVMPVMSKLGCNQGTCHGSAQGKNGFKLSLRGYDPVFDIRALTDDHASRRVNLASPDDSLMLLKPTGAVPHVGGKLLNPGEPYYEILRRWIADGAKVDLGSPRVVSIEVEPRAPIVQNVGGRQQLRVLATYSDGSARDVTREAFVESGNIEVATADRSGLATALRRGEAPLLVRFEGAYAAVTLTVMGNREGFVWTPPETWGRVDELVAAKWERMKIQPSELATDAEFLRRVHIDLTGLPPTSDEVRAFLADPRPTRVKRDEVVDRLIGSPDYVEYWTNKWADLLQVNRKFLGVEGAAAFRAWIRAEVEGNTPYDEFARKILTATGSNKTNPPASYYKILRDADLTMENTTHLFLALRFNCNKCHDHPFERWTQDQYYETAAFFAQVGLKADPEAKGQQIGATAVEAGKPLYEIVEDRAEGRVIHERTGEPVEPEFPFPVGSPIPESGTRRERLAAWITAPDNPYFAPGFANRMWGYLFGVGIMDPIDDLRAGNPPSNPELLAYLSERFVESGFDVRRLQAEIVKSRTYQLSYATNKWNEDDKINYSHAIARRLPAEVLYDAIHRVAGATSNLPGVPPGTRAAALPDSGVELPGGFFATFGRPARESACECERSSGMQLGPVMALVSGPTVGDAIDNPNNALAKLVDEIADDRALIEEVFLRVVNRPPTPSEVETALNSRRDILADHQALMESLAAAEAEAMPIRERLERERLAAIDAARAAYEAHRTAIAPKVAEAEAARVARVAALEGELNALRDRLVAEKLAAFQSLADADRAAWTPLEAVDARSNDRSKLTNQPDFSIVASEGGGAKAIYTVRANSDLPRITALRLEAIADPGLPGGGPGRAPNGNFVLTEFKVSVAPKATPDKDVKPVKLADPVANFVQPSFSAAGLIDGNENDPANGWAIHPAMGVTHWVTFQLPEPIELEGGASLTFTLVQRYDNDHKLGRFRLSATDAAEPVGLSLADDYRAILSTPAEERTPEQLALVAKYVSMTDGEYAKKLAELNQARAPLPEDARLVELREALRRAEAPVPVDPRLAALRADAAMSLRQVANLRLTAVQDLAWALVNSPEFLFNH